jgi:hypothetical protein
MAEDIKGYKMLFNTGVRPYNRLNLSGPNKGKFILGKWEELVNNQIHIAYYLERKPDDNMILKYLTPAWSLEENGLYDNHVAIKIIDGGMMSDYAVFLVYNKGV